MSSGVKTTEERLNLVKEHVRGGSYCVMIIGLGSVGSYLLDYLVSLKDPAMKIVVVGRSYDKLEMKVNIVRISALIREQNVTQIRIASDVDLNDISAIRNVIEEYRPDFIVNSSRAYPGLKYGTISWSNIRAYGIWSPLAICFTRNIMQACEEADTDAVLINTSYSDAVIPWLKSAGKAYPDFGSGNLNHLVPRMRYAAAARLGIEDFWNVQVMFAAGHFHDVCISKEGQTEGVDLPLVVRYRGEEQKVNKEDIFAACKIPMPTDEKRNMMNASSNLRLIKAIVECARTGEEQLVFSPGVFGQLGGYPVQISCENDIMHAQICEKDFSLAQMQEVNRQSMALDGVKKIENGTLFYTEALQEKVKNAFGVTLPEKVTFAQIDEVAQFLIQKIILPQTEK